MIFHYVVEGPPDSPFAGGFYHGLLKFPAEYPMKPPSVLMLTPNGRFSINTRICLSYSDFHPETWNPVWSCSTILMGLLSFMAEEAATAGSISTSDDTKRRYAAESLAHNLKNADFARLFPELGVLHEERRLARAAAGPGVGGGGGGRAADGAAAAAAGGNANAPATAGAADATAKILFGVAVAVALLITLSFLFEGGDGVGGPDF